MFGFRQAVYLSNSTARSDCCLCITFAKITHLLYNSVLNFTQHFFGVLVSEEENLDSNKFYLCRNDVLCKLGISS